MQVNIEPITKPLSTAIGCKARRSALSIKKVLDVHEARLRAFFTSSLDHGPFDFALDRLFARSRHKTGFGMDYSNSYKRQSKIPLKA
jgi:hypothetical protein